MSLEMEGITDDEREEELLSALDQDTIEEFRKFLEKTIADDPGMKEFLTKNSRAVNKVLHKASMSTNNHKSVEQMKLLIEFGADFESKYTDATPLITAMYCNYNSVEFIQLFMNRGTDMTQTDENKNSLLHIAVGNDEPEMIKFLLSLSATIVNIECKNMSGHTPLIYAVDIKARNSIPLLLESGADPNMAGVNGRRPLHYAVSHNDANSVRILLEHGAFPFKADNNGVLPIVMTIDPEIREKLKMANDKYSAEFQKYEQEIEEAALNKDLSCKLQEILLCIELESSSQVVNALRVDLNKAVIEEDLDQIYHVSKKIQSYLTNHSAFLGHIVEVNEVTKKAVNALRALERVAKEVAMESMGNLKSIPRVIACLSLRKRLLTYIEHQVKEGHFNHSDAMEESCEDSCSITASSSTSESFAERKCPLPYDETASEPSFKKTKMEE